MQNTEEIREIILKELPKIIKQDPEIQQLILRLSREHFAEKKHTEDWFHQMLNELHAERERQDKKWEEQERKWKENQEALREERERQDKKWWENQKALREERERQDKQWWENQKALREERERQDKKWWENQEVINNMQAEIDSLDRRVEIKVGALGARWGIQTEQAFRNGIQGILEDFSQVQIFNVNEYDNSGQVFGHPDQVELDLIIKDNTSIVAEIKSAVSKAEVYVLERKARFYEQLHNCRISRIMIISPFIDNKALAIAKKLDIEVYETQEDVSW